MKYFAHLGRYNVPKNKLQQALANLLDTLDGSLISDEFKFINKLKEEVEQLNKDYPKCAPLRVSTWEIMGEDIGISFGEVWGCNVYLFKVKGGRQ